MMHLSFADAARSLAGLSALALGWRPDDFWRATPDELATALQAGSPAPAAPPDAQAIAALRALFPDETEACDGR